MKKAILIALALLSLCMVESCKSTPEKQKYIWICTDANFKRLSQKDSICAYLDKIKQTGFNNIIVDVKGVDGLVMYKSSIYPELTEVDGFKCERDWDYLSFFIEQAHKRGIKVTASMSVFPVGSPYTLTGPAYTDPAIKDLTCLMYTPQGMIKIEDRVGIEVAAFMNPALPASREYALTALREVLDNYDIDGLALDYCRYPGAGADFSEASRQMFEQWLGLSVDRFPEDIFTYDTDGEIVPGKFYKQWWTWRAGVIKSFIASVRDEIDANKPDVKLSYWAATWVHALYKTGQNWTSTSAEFSKEYTDIWASDTYNETGFAELLDIFIPGAYLETVWGMDDLTSIEYGLYRSNRDINGACTVVGSIYGENTREEFEDAVYCCMRDTDGVMVFDLTQVEGYNLWSKIKAGIDRAEKESKK